tara:strand:+ start:2073 stop:2204 length:132 start_codon:yes stop_codon:yes gene_type:complete
MNNAPKNAEELRKIRQKGNWIIFAIIILLCLLFYFMTILRMVV